MDKGSERAAQKYIYINQKKDLNRDGLRNKEKERERKRLH